MSRKVNCCYNALAESFFKTLKTEEIYGNKLLSKNRWNEINNFKNDA